MRRGFVEQTAVLGFECEAPEDADTLGWHPLAESAARNVELFAQSQRTG